ncbi:hypothetical protein NDA14_005243 [Ustilago hordei]|nr:hypothetical protein NDA14_005243 [Ustilago hordei]
MRRTKLKEQAQPRRGPSSDGYHSGARETRVIGHWQAGPEEEEQCRGSRHQVMRRRSSVEESTPGHEEEEQCQRSRHQVMRRRSSVKGLGTININVMMTPRSGVSVDDDEVDGVGDEIGDVDDNEVDGVGDKVGGVNTSVQCVDLMLEVIPGPQWTTAFGSIYIRTANLLWAPSDVR